MTRELPPAGTPAGLHPRLAHGIDRLLTVQRPVVLAHIRSIRRSRPDASPDQLVRILERRYLTAVTSGGALVGASAAIPAIGVGTSLALSGVETAGFLEASALFAQSVTEVHGIAVVEPDRARTLVMTMILGSGGQELVAQFAAQAVGRGQARPAFWGELVTRTLPGPLVGALADRVKQVFLRRFALRQGGTVVGRAIPFGVGAAIGGTGNHLLGRRVIASARSAFGPPPPTFPTSLDHEVRAPKEPKRPRDTAVPEGSGAPWRLRLRLPGRRRERAALPTGDAAEVPGNRFTGGEGETAPPPPDPSTRRPD